MIDTVLEPCRRPVYDAALAETLATSGEVEQITRNDGEISFRVRGLEFARTQEGAVLFGLLERRPLREHNLEEACRLARDIGVLRQNGGSLSAQGPELWLESQVRKEVEEIDASLLREPIYGQVPAFAGGERGVLDLLAVDRTGRLAVIELKASSDLHLPMQALDYWARVKNGISNAANSLRADISRASKCVPSLPASCWWRPPWNSTRLRRLYFDTSHRPLTWSTSGWPWSGGRNYRCCSGPAAPPAPDESNGVAYCALAAPAE